MTKNTIVDLYPGQRKTSRAVATISKEMVKLELIIFQQRSFNLTSQKN